MRVQQGEPAMSREARSMRFAAANRGSKNIFTKMHFVTYVTKPPCRILASVERNIMDKRRTSTKKPRALGAVVFSSRARKRSSSELNQPPWK